MDEANLVLLEIDPPFASLALNRPARHNSLIPPLLEGMLGALDEVRAREDVRVALLRAEGRSFSTGGDLRGFADHLEQIESYAGRLVGLLNQVMLAMLALPVPVVTTVQGMVSGGSLGLVLASDFVLISPEASFTPFYSLVGFSPDGGWTALLPEIIGLKRTMEIITLNRTISSQQALGWGLAWRLVPTKRLQDEARALARELVSKQPASLWNTKYLLLRTVPNLAARLEAERVNFVKQIATPETQRSMLAFLEEM